jgi:hypothetical protein
MSGPLRADQFPTAIDEGVAGEIAGLPVKTTPVGADLLMIEDSAASDAKRSIQIASIPGLVSVKEEVFTAAGGDESFALASTPATNAFTLSGSDIWRVQRNNMLNQYDATPADSNDWGFTGPQTIDMKGLTAGDIITVLYNTGAALGTVGAVVSTIYSERQTITATNNFDGALPGTVSVDTNLLTVFPTDTGGGRFELLRAGNFAANTETRLVKNVILDLDGNTTEWKVFISDGTIDNLIVGGTNEADVVLTDDFVLAYDQFIKVTTAGATGTLVAQVAFQRPGL